MSAAFRTFLFDCDSTLSKVEGVDQLAGGRADVAGLTKAAMDGVVPLDQVYARRLELVRPSRADLDRIGRKYVENETEDAIYAHPERICSGIYAIKLTWPDVNDKTNIMMELDSRKDAQDKSECTLSIFYDSVKFPIDPASSAKMHEVL